MKKIIKKIFVLAMVIATIFTTVVPAQAASVASFTNMKASNITTNSARVDFNISNPSRKVITQAGLEIKESTAKNWTVKTDIVPAAYRTYSSLPCWYLIGSGKEVNLALKAGTTYQYRAFGVVGGVKYYSGTNTFTTGGKAPTTAKSTAANVQAPTFNSLRASDVTSTGARIDFNVANPGKLSVSTVSLQVRKKGTTTWTTKADTVATSWRTKTSIPSWYIVGSGKEVNMNLQPSTTYEYRAYCVAAGKTYYSGTYTFTTKPLYTPTFNSLRTTILTGSYARVNFNTINPDRMDISTISIDIRQKGDTSWKKTKTDYISSSYRRATSIPSYYDIGSGQEVNYTLKPNTTYEYRIKCVANGKTYYSSVARFTTYSNTRTIMGNGTGGIKIDINAAPYSTKKHRVNGYEISYTSVGCTWFVASRVEQLTGKKNVVVHGPGNGVDSWLRNASYYGFKTGTSLRGRSIAVFSGHVLIVEKIEGNYMYISEGGCWGYGCTAQNGYCRIAKVHKDKIRTDWGTLLGFVYF